MSEMAAIRGLHVYATKNNTKSPYASSAIMTIMRQTYMQRPSSVRLAQALQVDQLKVPALASQQLPVRAVLDHAALVKDVDHVGLLDGAEPVRDCDGGAALGGRVEGRLHHLLGLGV